MHKIELIGKLLGKSADRGRTKAKIPAVMPGAGYTSLAEMPLSPLIVVGASTGGPHALAELLTQLPEDLEAGIVIVQHVDPAFARDCVSGSRWKLGDMWRSWPQGTVRVRTIPLFPEPTNI